MKIFESIPVSLVNDEFIAAAGLVKELLELELTSLLAFKRNNAMRRQSHNAGQSLPVMPALTERVAPTLRQLIALVLNVHLQIEAGANKIMVVEANDQELVVHYYAGSEIAAKAIIDKIVLTWQHEVMTELMFWHMRLDNKNIYLDCYGYDYFPAILAYCFHKPFDFLKSDFKLAVRPLKAPGRALCRMELLTDFSRAIDPIKDIPHACKFLTATKMRVQYHGDFFKDIMTYCHKVLPEVEEKHAEKLLKPIMLIVKYCEDYEQNVNEGCKKILGMFNIVANKYPQMSTDPASYSFFPMIATYCAMRVIAENLNDYANKNDKVFTNDSGKVCLEISSTTGKNAKIKNEKIIHDVDLQLLVPVIPVMNSLADKLAVTDTNVVLQAKNIGIEIQALLNFYSESNDDKAKAELAKVVYLRFMRPCSNLLLAIASQCIATHDAALEATLVLVYRAFKKTAEHYPVAEHKNDCLFFQTSSMSVLLGYYKETTNWDKLESYLAGFFRLIKKMKAMKYDVFILEEVLNELQILLNLERGCLAQAVSCYHKMAEEFENKLAKVKSLKVDDFVAKFSDAFTKTCHLMMIGCGLAMALVKRDCNLLALEVVTQAHERFQKRLVKIKGFIKPPMSFAEQTLDGIRGREVELLGSFAKCCKRAQQQHFSSLLQCLHENAAVALPFTITENSENLQLVICPRDVEDLRFFRLALKKTAIAVVVKDDVIEISHIVKVTAAKLKWALALMPALKVGDQQKQQALELLEKREVDQSPPTYSYFVDLLKPIGTVLPKQKIAKQKSQQVQELKAVARQRPLLCVDFGQADGFARVYDEAKKIDAQIIALEDDYRPFGVFFGYIDPKLPKDVQVHFSKALANREANLGRIVTGKGREGVKFFKKAGVKAWKIKIPQQDEFLVGRVVKELQDQDQHGMPIRRFLICFDQVQTHKQEQREQKLNPENRLS